MDHILQSINTLGPRQNGYQFPDDIFKCNILNENIWILIKISLKFVPNGLINNIPALVQIMAWRWPGDKPLSEPMMVYLLMHICITRPQWVKLYNWIVLYEKTVQFILQLHNYIKCPCPPLLSMFHWTKNYFPCSHVLCLGNVQGMILPISWFFYVWYFHHHSDVTWISWHIKFQHHQPSCLFNCLFRLTTKKTSKLHITGLYWGNGNALLKGQ